MTHAWDNMQKGYFCKECKRNCSEDDPCECCENAIIAQKDAMEDPE